MIKGETKMIKLGIQAEDIETGFTGIVTGRVEYLYNPSQVLLEGIDTTGRPVEWWVSELRVKEVVDEAKIAGA